MRGLGLGLGGDEDAMSELSDLSDLSELTALSDLDMEVGLESGGGEDARVTVFPSLTPATAQAPIPVPQIAQPISPTLPSSAIASSSAYDPPHLPALKRLAAHAALPVIMVSPPVETMRGSVPATTKEGKRAWKEKPTQLIYAYPGASNFIATSAAQLVFPLPARAPSSSALSSLTTTSASSTVPQLILTHLTNARPVAEQIRLKQLLRSSDPAWTSSTKGWKALERSVCAGWIGRRAVEVAKEKERRGGFFRDGEEGLVADEESGSASPLSSPSEDMVTISSSPSSQTSEQACPHAQDTSTSPPPPSPPKSTTSPPPPQPIPVTLATTIAYPRLEQRHRFSPRVPSRLRIANVVVPVRARPRRAGLGDGEDSESGDTDVDVDMDDVDAETDAERSSDTIPIASPEQEAASAVKGSRLYRRIEQFVVGGAGGVISTFGPGPDADVTELSLDGLAESAADGAAAAPVGNEERINVDDTNASASTCVPSSPSVSFLAESASSEVEDGEEATSARFEREPTPVPSSPSASLSVVEDQASSNSPLQTPPQSPSVFPRQYPQAWHRRHAEHRMEPPVWKWASLSRVESS